MATESSERITTGVPLEGDVAKMFAGVYALYSGLLLIAVTGIILAPVLHAIHADEQD